MKTSRVETAEELDLRHSRERAALEARVANRNWAEKLTATWDQHMKRAMLQHLIDERTHQIGHPSDCACGECD